MLRAVLLIVLAGLGCGGKDGDPAYATPAATFGTLKQALSSGDFDAAWHCYSSTYRADVLKDDQATWTEQMQRDPAQVKAITRREISAERAINERIGYLLFETSTLPSPRQSPFFYFIREAQGWKITSHLDTVFHRELEEAIQKGQFKLAVD